MNRTLSLILGLSVWIVACGPADEDDNIAADADADADADSDSDSDTEFVDPLEPGLNDAYAAMACDNQDVAGAQVIAAASQAEAAQATIVTSNSPYTIVMPETGEGWVMMEIPDWMAYVRYFSEDEIQFELVGGEESLPLSRNAACPDDLIKDYPWEYHDWGAYPIRFAAENPRSFWFMAVLEP